MPNERKLTKAELKKREDIVMDMKKNKRELVKRYGKDAEAVMYGRATKLAKQKTESMNSDKLRGMIKDALQNPKKADLNKDGKLSSYEKKRGAAIEKAMLKEDEMVFNRVKEIKHLFPRVDEDIIVDFVKTHIQDIKGASDEEIKDEFEEFFSVNYEGIPDYVNENTGEFVFSEDEVRAAANLIAKAISTADKVKTEVHDFEYDEGRGAGFDISMDGDKSEGGSYTVRPNGDVVNDAIGNLHPNAVYSTIGNKDINVVLANIKKYESGKSAIDESKVNEDKYYITRNLGRGQGMSLVKDLDKPKEFKSYKDAKKEADRLERGSRNMTAYFVSDKDMKIVSEPVINESKSEAAYELQDIMDQLYELSDRAKQIIRSEFPSEYSRLDAYGALDFGTSSNRYDVTFEKALEDLDMEDDDEDMINEDLDLGHQDDEPGMLKGDLYRIGKYAMELYQMMDSLEGKGEVDFPHWWQSKIIKAKDMVVGAKHYLDFELKEPQIDAMVDIASEEDVIDEAVGGKPSQEEVDKFFEETFQETHYLASKPVEEWDEYDMSNWKAKLKKKEQDRPQFGENITEKLAKKLAKESVNENFAKFDTLKMAVNHHEKGVPYYDKTRLINIFNQLSSSDQVKAKKQYSEYFGKPQFNENITEKLAKKLAKELKK